MSWETILPMPSDCPLPPSSVRPSYPVVGFDPSSHCTLEHSSLILISASFLYCSTMHFHGTSPYYPLPLYYPTTVFYHSITQSQGSIALLPCPPCSITLLLCFIFRTPSVTSRPPVGPDPGSPAPRLSRSQLSPVCLYNASRLYRWPI